MGTNYYAIPKMTQEQKAEAILAINKDEFSKAISLLPKEVHIGKSSAGWDFILNHNDWLYYNNYEEMKSWLSKCEIHNEYGEVERLDDFIEMVEIKKTNPSKMNNPEWYIWKDDYVFSTSTEFS